MSTSTDPDDADFRTLGTDVTDLEQYAEVSLEGGGIIIYDQENSDAWIQSDPAIDLEATA